MSQTGARQHKMKYWQIVDAGDFEKYSINLLKYFYLNRNHFNSINSFWNAFKPEHYEKYVNDNPDFKEGIEKFGPINEIALLILTSDSSTLHEDHRSGLNKYVKARLNIPVINCKGSYTCFFELTREQYEMAAWNAGMTIYWPHSIRNTVKPVSTVELIQPTILRTSSPHTVFCTDCKFPRISMTISFKNDLVEVLDK